jgi:hypothetical protein
MSNFRPQRFVIALFALVFGVGAIHVGVTMGADLTFIHSGPRIRFAASSLSSSSSVSVSSSIASVVRSGSVSSGVASSTVSSQASSDDFYLGKFDPPAAVRKPPNQRGPYLSAPAVGKAGFLDYTFEQMDSFKSNAFVMDVKGSNVYFDANAPLARELGLVKPKYDIREVLDRAHAKGYYVIGRFIALKDPLFSSLNSKAQIRHPKTNVSVGSVWVDGSHATTLEYNEQILRSLVASGIDEVNLDYIRYPTEYGQWQIGLTGAEKADRIEQFIKMARRVIDEVHPQTKLGISSYAILGWNFKVNLEPLGQDVVRFAPYLDVISPMAYPSTFSRNAYWDPKVNKSSRAYYLVWKTLDGYKKLLGEEHAWKLRPWIQAYYMTSTEIRDEIDAVYDSGACGFTFWNANANFGPAYGALKQRTNIPERCL